MLGSAISIMLALMLILIGLVGVYSGYKFFKVYLSLVAFIFGFLFGINIFGGFSIVSVIVAFVIGFVFSALSFTFYKLALFIAFAAFGASFGAWFLSSLLQIQGEAWVNVLGAVIGFGIGLILLIARIDKPAIIVITALLGSYYIVTGVAGLFEGTLMQISISADLLPTSLEQANYITGRAAGLIMSNFVYLGIFVFFLVTGLLNQFKLYNKKNKH